MIPCSEKVNRGNGRFLGITARYNRDMKKNIVGVVGLLLLVGFVMGGWQYLGDWSTAELWGYNVFGLVELIGGAWLVYYGLTNRNTT